MYILVTGRHNKFKVSVLFSEPKIPQLHERRRAVDPGDRFSALQRAENSSTRMTVVLICVRLSFSALQRAEIAEIKLIVRKRSKRIRFSALQRAEIAEILTLPSFTSMRPRCSFSALQRAEIAEMQVVPPDPSRHWPPFQCSSTSRNC